MTEYQPGQPADVVFSSLKSAADSMEKAKQNAILWFGEVDDRKLYRQLGYSTIHQYAEQELGFGKSKTYDFLNICNRLKELPKVKEGLESGKLGYTGTREILKVTDETNQDQWIEVAANHPRREVERQVKRAKKQAEDKKVGQASLLPSAEKRSAVAVEPVLERLKFSPTQFARYEKLWEKARKQGGIPAGKTEALLEMMAYFVAANSTRVENVDTSADHSVSGPPVQIHIHQCPDCEKSTVQTSRGELALSIPELEQAQCDCHTSRPGQRNTTSIPPKTRRQVLARDRHRCQKPGCENTRYLEIHHLVARSSGGTNEIANLTTLCRSCHQLLHEKKSAQSGFFVKSPQTPYEHQFWGMPFNAYPGTGQACVTNCNKTSYGVDSWNPPPTPTPSQGTPQYSKQPHPSPWIVSAPGIGSYRKTPVIRRPQAEDIGGLPVTTNT